MLRMLICDDEPVNREFLLHAVAGLGEAVAVASGEEALREIEAALNAGRPFGAVFMDLLMPGMGGLRTLETLRALEDARALPPERRAPVIVTTSLDDNKTASRAFIHGRAAAYLTKPFAAEAVREEMEKLGLVQP